MLNLLNNSIQGNLAFALAIFYIFLLDGECPLSILEFPPEWPNIKELNESKQSERILQDLLS